MNEKQIEILLSLKRKEIEPMQVNSFNLTKEEKKEIIDNYIDWIESSETEFVVTQEDEIDKLTTEYTFGTPSSDSKFTPIQPHSYIVLAGIASSGKTAFSFDMATKNALLGIKTLYISLEMTGQQVKTRVACASARITKEQWRSKRLITDNQKSIYRSEISRLNNLKELEIAGVDNPTITNILELIEKKCPHLVFIDNLDLITVEGNNRNEHQSNVSKLLMNFTNKQKIPIILIHHISKGGEKFDIDSIRGSGKITDDADGVFMCYRNTNAEEELSAEDKSKFIVAEKKDRLFGAGGYHMFYFHKGSFYDSYQGTIQTKEITPDDLTINF